MMSPDNYGPYGVFSGLGPRKLRVKITGRDGVEKLDLRIPVGLLKGIANTVLALGGVNIKEMLDDALDEAHGKILLDYTDTMGDRNEVIME